MKSPAAAREALRRQWQNAERRAERLLGGGTAWPVSIPIPKPTHQQMLHDVDAVKQHVESWRQVRNGEVVWDDISYRVTETSVRVPRSWVLRQPSDWIDATGDATVRRQFADLARLVDRSDACFHNLLVRQLSLWTHKPIDEVIAVCQLAASLEPDYAAGRPLRMISAGGIDTKFFERHETLIRRLLDERFDGEPSRLGLHQFLGALDESKHWLLVVDLDGSLLPFRRQRVQGQELRDTPLPADRLLVVENETSQHQLPIVANTIAVLGTGFDVTWLGGPGLAGRRIAYWGDIDTWGFYCLAMARECRPEIQPLLMTNRLHEENLANAVPEPTTPDVMPRCLT